MSNRLFICDMTLCDTSQTSGTDLSINDKHRIVGLLDKLGVAYIECGRICGDISDDNILANPPAIKNARLASSGLICRIKQHLADSAEIDALLSTQAKAAFVSGDTWDLHIKETSNTKVDNSFGMIRDTVSFLVSTNIETIFDAEHFFDGFKSNSDFAINCLKQAWEAGASWIVLCDTNGGTLPHEIEATVMRVKQHLPDIAFGIHCMNDTGNAVANTLAAVRSGCALIKGTILGTGQRCGNANLASLIPTLHFKMGYDVGVSQSTMANLSSIGNAIAGLIGRPISPSAPYVGKNAFAHQNRARETLDPEKRKTLDHVSPTLVGNRHDLIASVQTDASDIRFILETLGLRFDKEDAKLETLVAKILNQNKPYCLFDRAPASLAIVCLRMLDQLPDYFAVENCTVQNIGHRTLNNSFDMTSYASAKIIIGDQGIDAVAQGSGPVHALDSALRKALRTTYPEIDNISIYDYRAQFLDAETSTAAQVNVILECENNLDKNNWTTIGASTNIVYASLQALCDSYMYAILRHRQPWQNTLTPDSPPPSNTEDPVAV